MMNDTVREELQTKITPSARLPKIETPKYETPLETRPTETRPVLAPPPRPVILEKLAAEHPAPTQKRVVTAGLSSPKTSPTLVEFQNKNTQIPEWRLQMQNAVRQRKGTTGDDGGSVNAVSMPQTQLATHGATALKAEVVEQPVPMPEIENADPRLNAALRRIADSRRAFSPEDAKAPAVAKPAPKSFPFNVVAPTPNQPVRPPRPIESAAVRPKPAMVTPLRMEKKLDTNKLPRIETIITEKAVEITAAPDPLIEETASTLPAMPVQTEFAEVKRIVINSKLDDPETDEYFEVEEEEIEDLAPFSMRFNAGVFDLIIGAVASMLVLSPFALTGGNWASGAGALTFAGTCAIIMFVYLTSSIGFFGKTLGMRLFSLELVDAEENEYPTLHQAAVSSSLYILSLVFGGLGFLTIFFNEEKRAMHDLLSGTIIVREF